MVFGTHAEAQVRVHVVDAGNRDGYAAALSAMHRHRHRLFVDTLGWQALASPDGLESDGYDTDAATYLLVLDGAGALRASARFLPTDGPHMLADVFPHFVAQTVPRGPAIMEWTRHAPGDPAWAPEINDAARMALHLGVLEFARLRGVTAFTAVMETWLVRRAQAMGWPCAALGPAQAYGEGTAVAVLNTVAPDHLERLRAKAGRHDAVLVVDTALAA